jgi:hypothetical protein
MVSFRLCLPFGWVGGAVWLVRGMVTSCRVCGMRVPSLFSGDGFLSFRSFAAR